jgi:hypothetical protein
MMLKDVDEKEQHPALRVIGVAGGQAETPDPYDIAREHDRYLADLEVERATRPRRKTKRSK